jgi:hypothetical protein
VVGNPQVQSPSARGVNNKLKIKLMGEVRDEDGIHLAITTWEPRDGGGWTVTVIHNEFTTALGAQEYLDKQVAKAVKVIRRGNARRNRKIDGKRVELIVRGIGSNGSEGEGPAVLRTDGPQFYEVLSDSFAHIARLGNP